MTKGNNTLFKEAADTSKSVVFQPKFTRSQSSYKDDPGSDKQKITDHKLGNEGLQSTRGTVDSGIGLEEQDQEPSSYQPIITDDKAENKALSSTRVSAIPEMGDKKLFKVSSIGKKYHNVEYVVTNISQHSEDSLAKYAVDAIIGEGSDETVNQALIDLIDSLNELEGVKDTFQSAIKEDVYLLQEKGKEGKKRRGANNKANYGQIIGLVIDEGSVQYAIASKSKEFQDNKLRFYEYRDENEMPEIENPTHETVQLFADKLGVGEKYRQKYTESTVSESIVSDLKSCVLGAEVEDENIGLSPIGSSSGSVADKLSDSKIKMILSEGHIGGAYKNTNFKFFSKKEYQQARDEAIVLLDDIILSTSIELINRYMPEEGRDKNDNNIIKKEDIINVIDYAIKNGGISHRIRTTDDGSIELVRNEFLTKDDRWAMDFSRTFQRLCKECGIYASTNIKGSAELSGMQLGRIPPEVFEKFKEKDINSIKINDNILEERKSFVSNGMGMAIA